MEIQRLGILPQKLKGNCRWCRCLVRCNVNEAIRVDVGDDVPSMGTISVTGQIQCRKTLTTHLVYCPTPECDHFILMSPEREEVLL